MPHLFERAHDLAADTAAAHARTDLPGMIVLDRGCSGLARTRRELFPGSSTIMPG
ncbi:hypothetical protein [Micromonospora sp. WMMD710]|uniref:hypothetical protein n=1 Tax=Micromonospora sp. WMMD710 TaxID=3016085 RepID=UPI002416C82C|nr:hypothetical protein [Micromonospora sp. WMMD710]MDG4761463.1 hypothetical protein [Micromonospora sp. WMMD710]